MVSVLHQYGKDRVPSDAWTRSTIDTFKKLVTETEKLDEALGEPDCVDIHKTDWLKEVEARLTALEAAAFRNP